MAIGKENVLGVIMPSQYTSSESIEDATALSKNLGINTHLIPITGTFKTYLNALSPIFSGRKPDSTEENIQARIRGNLLMAISNKYGHLVLSTGNKSELAVGYCTLYGDLSGGFALISDLPKTTVYRIARYINEVNGNPIPERILTKAPSAELRLNQKDQDDLPPYDVLDAVLELYIEKRSSLDEIISQGFDRDVVRRIILMVNRSEYKRRQAPPGPKITSKAFGCGRRYPLSHSYHF
jgi:NAD+ synthase (glutamine-hydrolysing)